MRTFFGMRGLTVQVVGLAGSRKTCDALARQGFPIRLFVMPKAAHSYSADIDERMRQALAFVLAYDRS